MLCFGALALCFFFLQQRQKPFGAKWLLALIATSVSFGLAISIKWTGVATI
jgi:dolichyl-phosphate-mannose--protein O-mannosyl transferase